MVYNIKKSMPSKIIYFAFILLLSFMFVIGIPCTQAQAFVPFVVAGVTIAPEVVAAGAALLIAGGLIFASKVDAETAFKDMFLFSNPQMRANLLCLRAGVNIINDVVWNGVNSYINKKFNANEASKSISVIYGEHTFGTTVLPYTTNINSPVIASKNTFTFPANFSTFYSLGSGSNSKSVLTAGTTIYPVFNSTSLSLYTNNTIIKFYDATNGYLFSYFKYLADVNFFILRESDANYWLCINSISSSGTAINTKVCKLDTVTDALNNESYVASSSSVVSPTYDYKNTEGTRNLSVPQDTSSLVGQTAEDVQTYAEPTTSNTDTPTNVTTYPNSWTGAFKDCTPNMTAYNFTGSGTITGDMDYSRTGTWEGSWNWTSTGARQWTGTFTDADGNTWTGTATQVLEDAGEAVTPGMSEETKTWWQNLINTVSTPIAGALEGMTGTLADIKKAIADGLQTVTKPMIDAITAVKDAVIADTAAEAESEPDLTPQYKNYNIPDLLLLLLLVIIAFIRLVLKALVWIIELYGLNPSSDMLNPYIVLGIEFLKNQQIQYFNMSFWDLVNILFTVLFGLGLITIGKKFILSLGSSGALGSLYLKKNGQGRI